jgi:hypothetical protein
MDEGPYQVVRLACGKTANVVGPFGIEMPFRPASDPKAMDLAERVRQALNRVYALALVQG